MSLLLSLGSFFSLEGGQLQGLQACQGQPNSWLKTPSVFHPPGHIGWFRHQSVTHLEQWQRKRWEDICQSFVEERHLPDPLLQVLPKNSSLLVAVVATSLPWAKFAVYEERRRENGYCMGNLLSWFTLLWIQLQQASVLLKSVLVGIFCCWT